jgi:hypothetical protein
MPRKARLSLSQAVLTVLGVFLGLFLGWLAIRGTDWARVTQALSDFPPCWRWPWRSSWYRPFFHRAAQRGSRLHQGPPGPGEKRRRGPARVAELPSRTPHKTSAISTTSSHLGLVSSRLPLLHYRENAEGSLPAGRRHWRLRLLPGRPWHWRRRAGRGSASEFTGRADLLDPVGRQGDRILAVLDQSGFVAS